MDLEPQNEENSEQEEIKPGLMEKFVSARIANIFFIIISVALVVGVFLNFWLNNQFDVISQPLLTDSNESYVSEEDAQQWKTYTDYDYYFSINYPENWELTIKNNDAESLRSAFFYNSEGESPERGVIISIVTQEEHVASIKDGLFLTVVGSIEQMNAADLFKNPEFLTEESFISETNLYTFLGDFVFNFRLDLDPEETLTQELKQVYMEIFNNMIESFEFNVEDSIAECRPTGCSNQICSDEEVTTTCEYTEAFACYETAVCERQVTGACAWAVTDNLRQCLRSAVGVEGVTTQEISQ